MELIVHERKCPFCVNIVHLWDNQCPYSSCCIFRLFDSWIFINILYVFGRINELATQLNLPCTVYSTEIYINVSWISLVFGSHYTIFMDWHRWHEFAQQIITMLERPTVMHPTIINYRFEKNVVMQKKKTQISCQMYRLPQRCYINENKSLLYKSWNKRSQCLHTKPQKSSNELSSIVISNKMQMKSNRWVGFHVELIKCVDQIACMIHFTFPDDNPHVHSYHIENQTVLLA